MAKRSSTKSFFIQDSPEKQQTKTRLKINLFSILHQNVQSIMNKLDEIKILLTEFNNKYSVIAITEHWLVEHKVPMVQIPKYVVGSCFVRKTNIHGGRCLLVRNNILFDELVELKTKSKEFIIECSAIKIPKSNIIIINVYRSPSGDINEFMDTLEDILTDTFSKYTKYNIILCGDFNIDLLKNNEIVQNFICLLKTYNLQPTIDDPTRVTDRSSTLIDNIFVNFDLFESKVVTTALSDHHGQEVEFNTQENASTQTNIKKVGILTDIMLSKIKDSMQNIGWLNLINSVDPILNLERILYTIKMAITEHSPSRTSRCKEPKPWVDDEIRDKSKIKRQLYERTLRQETTWAEYKIFNKNLQQLIKQKKRQFYTNQISTSSNKIKTTWQIVKSITGKNTARDRSLLNDFGAGHDLEKARGLLDDFNKYYIHACHNRNYTQSSNAMKYVKRNFSSMFLLDTTPAEIFNIIHSLKNTNATGPDGITTKLLKTCAHELCEPLSKIINECFKIGIFPDQLKMTNIRPVYKAGIRTEIKNYRPIALISTVAKIFEKAIVVRVINFIERYNLISMTQNAYMPGRSTTKALYTTVKSNNGSPK